MNTKPFEIRGTVHSVASSVMSSRKRRSRVLLQRPDSLRNQNEKKNYAWLAYVATLFTNLKMHKMSA